MNEEKSIINCIIFLAIVFMCTGEVFRVLSIPVYVYLLGLASIVYLISAIKGNRNVRKVRRNLLFVLAVCWLIWGFILMWLTDIEYAFGFYRSLALNMLAILLIILTATDERKALYYSRAVMIGHIASLAVSIYELHTGNHIVQLDAYYSRVFAAKAFGFQVNVNDNATALFIGMFVLIISIITSRKLRIVKTFILAVTLYAIVEIDSRTAVGSVVIAGGMFVYTYFMSKLVRNRRLRVVVDFTFAIALLAGLIAVFYDNDLISVIVSIYGSESVYSDLLRLTILRTSLYYAYERLFFGLGTGVVTLKIGTNPHSLFMEVLADYGFVILFLLLKVLHTLTKTARLRTSQLMKSTIASFALGFVTVSVASSSMIRVRVAWIVLAIAFSLYRSYENEYDRNSTGRGTDSKRFSKQDHSVVDFQE